MGHSGLARTFSWGNQHVTSGMRIQSPLGVSWGSKKSRNGSEKEPEWEGTENRWEVRILDEKPWWVELKTRKWEQRRLWDREKVRMWKSHFFFFLGKKSLRKENFVRFRAKQRKLRRGWREEEELESLREKVRIIWELERERAELWEKNEQKQMLELSGFRV